MHPAALLRVPARAALLRVPAAPVEQLRVELAPVEAPARVLT